MDAPAFSEPTSRWLSEGRHVDLDGRRVFVYERGTGEAVFLLHGFPTSCYDWRGVIDILRASYRCIAFDFPGYGLSDKPVAYSYSLFQQTDMAEGIARALDIAEAHVVSHDVGQTVHAELLAREQEGRLAFRILSSTLLNGSTLQDKATITPIQQLLGSNETLTQAIAICENLSVNYVQSLKAIMKRPQVVSDEDAAVMEELLFYQQGNRRLPALAGYMRERYLHRERWLGAFKAAAPIQLVWADGDPIANLEMGRALSAELPQARYTELPGLGHFLPIEDPEAVAGTVLDFIRQPA
ncbi:MAG: alpha/beta hydrolase [Dehalococcoidia bacterium]|nr:alpha/beta hydrolase [Dehalococcoidia bacterium]